jgi:Putative Se/S carrier protein-like
MGEYNCFLFIFDSTHQALSAEKALKEAGVRHAVVNTPREFSAGCGIALRVEPAFKDKAVEVLDSAGVVYSRVEPYRSRWADQTG